MTIYMSVTLRCAAVSKRVAAGSMRRYGGDTQVVSFMEPMHILGGGSIGLLFAASVRSAFPSYPLALLLRESHRPKIDEDKKIMTCLIQRGRPRMVPVPAQIIGDQRPRPIQNLVVTTKAYAAADAVSSVLDRLQVSNDKGENASIIVLCNGAFAVKQELQQLLSESSLDKKVNLILATATHGAYQEKGDDELYRVVHAGLGKTFVEDHPAFSQLLDQSGLCSKSLSRKDMTVLLWQKLAANCAINPLTALYSCENGQIIEQSDSSLPSVEEVIQEVALVASLSAGDSTTLDYESLRSFVFRVIDDTFHNRSSMLQDVSNGKRTEVEFLNAYVVKMGKDLGIDTPANSTLSNRIQELSKGFE